MKRQHSLRRKGAVLLLILGLMAMFAISILTYMVVTSNMAETAVNSAKNDAVIEIPAREDVEVALKDIVLGSNNMRSPIGPFGILENMYGDWKDYDAFAQRYDAEFTACVSIFPDAGCAVVTPFEDYYGNRLTEDSMTDAQACAAYMSLFENSGSVLTFQGWENDATGLWRTHVEGTSAFVLDKVITNPSSRFYAGAVGDYWRKHYYVAPAFPEDGVDPIHVDAANLGQCDLWHFKVELTDDLMRFVEDYCGVANVNTNFNELKPMVTVRLNRPAYSGTGAGGFTPGEAKDATVPPELLATAFAPMPPNRLRLPFAFWGNAAAPDLRPFQREPGGKLDFRTFWAHLMDVNYDANQPDSTTGLRYVAENGVNWESYNSIMQGGAYLEPIRMNPAYTAPDHRSLFLAHYGGPMNVSATLPKITPSFHRPTPFLAFTDTTPGFSFLSLYEDFYHDAGVGADALPIWMTALVRKLTPRPLPYDHWNFTGGNDYLANGPPTGPAGAYLPGDLLAPAELARRLGNSAQWDVDNDGDGVREGVWVPSGLPIRVNKDGKAYATMFSYTVLDLDGRVNVNTAGNWDQLPNNMLTNIGRWDSSGAYYEDSAQPYSYVDELDKLWEDLVLNPRPPMPPDYPPGSVPGRPFFAADSLDGSFGWLDDSDNDVKIAVRGDGRGTSNVLLYEALSSIFDVSAATTSDVTRIASNLLWRRNLSTNNNPTGLADRSGFLDTGAITWTDAMMSSQPGSNDVGGVGLNPASMEAYTRAMFFRYMDPVRLDSASGDPSDTLLYPYRGKTTHDVNILSTAVYDFANTAFRSYDPLGAQVYTYAPRYSDNPYLASQNLLTLQDSPYSLPMLERLLRPWDSDSNALPTQLVDDLGLNVDLSGNTITENERAKARQSLTTLSSDVPAPSLVFPNNNELLDGEYRNGNYGFVELIRSCVRQELYKVFRAKGVCRMEPGTDPDGNPILVPTNYWLDNVNKPTFDAKVEEITAYLASMLPPEIMAGEKIDLNALAQKNYWLDIDDKDPSNIVATVDSSDRRLHNYGLVKRMERVRGLYIVMMTLLYEDMNADALYGDSVDPVAFPEMKLADYIEGSFDLLKYDNDELKGLMGRQLIATRIAQWCVNSIDFADPDATMTPFFFDPTPFDGWWLYDNDWIDSKLASGEYCWSIPFGGANPEPILPFLFDPLKGLPSEQMFHFFNDALNVSEAFVVGDYYIGPNGDVDFGPSFIKPEYDATGNLVPGTGVYGPRKRSDEYIAAWMSREIEELHDQSSDMGFRLCWGMERPDLILTETLSFHDLGIADTVYASDCVDEHGNKISDKKVVDGDDSFDQVRRPEGSTYLELYCTANPNVPQSRELYDYIDGMWQLRLTKTTPIYTDSDGRELTMPVWRVAISASADARGVNDNPDEELRKGNKLVYNKRRNSVLERLSPTKSGSPDNDYTDDISFFSMQPRQFRNYPMPYNAGVPNEIVNISDLDIIQKVKGTGDKVEEIADGKIHGDWKAFNLRSSNILGPAVAAKDDPDLTNEIELDRIVWFNFGEGGDSENEDGTKLGTAGKYPDALRTFVNVENAIQYLAPNQYLVVGPEKKRAIGSFAFNSTLDILGGHPRFGVKELAGNPVDLNRIDLEALGVPTKFSANAKYIVVESNIGRRGLNISEPLWLGSNPSMDPYRLVNADGKVKVIDPTLEPGADELPVEDKLTCAVMNVPFELPQDWSDGGRYDVSSDFYTNTIANYPIVQDELFGLGTVPAYKTAFVQRVADPNRPYHPLMNPYITVDWNMMDLTIFTGECVQPDKPEDGENKRRFTTGSGYPFTDDHNPDAGDQNNKIKLAANRALNVENDKTLSYNADAFSSRQWGNSAQRTFAPGLQGSYRPSIRPNPWARAFRGQGDKAGLQEPFEVGLPPGFPSYAGVPVIRYLPTHTLGMYNDMGPWGSWRADKSGFDEHNTLPGEFKNLNSDYLNSVSSPVYWGAPRVPFEHLVWNDAPYSNPMELALVPASSPGRFGLEFVRSEGNFDLGKLYDVRPGRKGSLGSFGVFGFKDWYHNGNIKDGADDDEEWKKLEGKANVMGPYLNFFGSSKKPGESLNLCKALEFVYVPSLFLGTKTLPNSNGHIVSEPVLANDGTVLAGSNPVLISKRREPGKININTVTKPSWQAIAPHSERLFVGDRLPGTPWDDFQNGRYPFETIIVGYETDGTPITKVVRRDYTYFQPSHTLGLWAQVDGSKAPVPSYTTFLAQQDCDLAQRNSSDEDPLFDNISPATDPSGARKYRYSYYVDPNNPTPETFITDVTADLDYLATLPEWADVNEEKTSRNNLYEATAEMQRLSGLTTTRSNVFAVWVTVGYFEVERCNPGVNMPQYDPDGNPITLENLTNSSYKWYQYYQAIYPDGYTYGKELGSEFGETERHRGFSIIDRSVPVDFRRGNSSNYKNSILLQRVID